MKVKYFYLIIITITLFITGCSQLNTDEARSNNPNEYDVADGSISADEDVYWAKENFDLQRVGNLLEKADDAEELEYLINSEDGINNLDLNGDGYTDYISVSEFDNGYDDQRGFTLFDRFGPNEIQEIARLIFDRNGYADNPGARILMVGNDQIYGDDNYYETNWIDRTIPIVSWLFQNRDTYYESPYYYNNYPDYYENYRVVETPVYRTRIEQYYPQPVFIYTNSPTITNIKVKSKYQDRSIEKIYARLAKPTKEQINFKKNNPNRPEFVQLKQEKVKDVPAKFKEKFKDMPNGNGRNFDNRGRGNEKNFEAKNNPPKMERELSKPQKQNNVERQIIQQNERPNMKPPKVERQMPKQMERPMPQMQRPNKPDNPGKGNGGGGNGKGNGGGNGGGKGKGKG